MNYASFSVNHDDVFIMVFIKIHNKCSLSLDKDFVSIPISKDESLCHFLLFSLITPLCWDNVK